MHEFENLTYLDPQKTGTTTIVKALRKLLAEKEVYADMHGPVPSGYDKSKNCFISVRDPLSLYISLFQFGVSTKRGTVYAVLERKRLSHYYEPTLEAFQNWLEFVLDPANARFVSTSYGRSAPINCIGVMTFRFLDTCMPNSRSRLEKLNEREKLEHVFQKKHLYSEYVRTECLYSDLFSVLRYWEKDIKFKSPLTTLDAMIASVNTRNVSETIEGLTADKITPRLRDLVREREWLIYKTFGYDWSPKGMPTKCVADREAQNSVI